MFPAVTSAPPLVERPSLESVKEAIKQVLSHDKSTDDRQAATQFLDSLKNSMFAWEICDQLLQAREGIEVCYIAANILRHKISRNYNELPLECYSSLKDSLMNKLQSIDDYAIQGQLTMAIADLTILLQVWKEPIEDLAKQLGLDIGLMSLTSTNYESIQKALNNRLIFDYILHQMGDINHDLADRSFKVGATRRLEYENYLMSRCGQVVKWWLTTLTEVQELKQWLLVSEQQSNNLSDQEVINRKKCIDTIDKLIGETYLCYSAWLRIFDEENLHDSLPLIDASFRHLSESNCPDFIHKYAVEVIVSTANHCEANDGALDYMVDHLLDQSYNLEPLFRQAVESEDIEKSSNFTKVFTFVAVAGCYRHVIQKKNFKIVELLLSCLNHYDYEIVEGTYAFWWELLDNIQYHLKKDQHGPYISFINRLLMAVTKLCQFDSDEEQVVPSDMEIHGFRKSTNDLISSVLFLTTAEDFIRDNKILETLSLNISAISWEKYEAVLFLVSCLVEVLSSEEDPLRMQIFNCIIAQQAGNPDTQGRTALNIGTSSGQVHPQVVATSLKIIGSIYDFIDNHPNYLTIAVSYILSSMSNEKYLNQLLGPATSTLGKLIEKDANHQISSSPQVLAMIKSYCMNLDQFDRRASSHLLACAGDLADAIKDPTTKDQFLCEISAPLLVALNSTLQPPKQADSEPLKCLDRLSSIFQRTNIEQPMVGSLKNFIALVDGQLWPMIVKVLEIYASEKGDIIEHACRTVRYLIRSIKPEWMIQRVAETMVSLYKTYPQNSSPIYICSILVDEFANKSAEINQGLFAMLEIFCELTFNLLNMEASQQKALLTMKNYPETIDDMMRLFKRFLRKCPNEFVSCKALEPIINLSISSLSFDHSDANLSVCKFVRSFIQLAQTNQYPHITGAVKNLLGVRIADAVIRACLFDVPYTLIPDEAEILMELSSLDKGLFEKWVESSVASLPSTNIQGIESVKQEQMEEFKRELCKASSIKLMITTLRSQARLYSY